MATTDAPHPNLVECNKECHKCDMTICFERITPYDEEYGGKGIMPTDLHTKEPSDPFQKFFLNSTDLYGSLVSVLYDAYHQAAFGKGKARHAIGDERFEDQFLVRSGKIYGSGGPLYQANKKMEESLRLDTDAAVNELLGAINYIAAAIIVIRKSNENYPGKC